MGSDAIRRWAISAPERSSVGANTKHRQLNPGVYETGASPVDADARSGRPPDVAMMQATDFGNRHDRAQLRRLDWPRVGRILVEREVSSCAVIVREVAGQDAAQMAFAQDEDMIQTLAPDRADEPLREGILPRAVGRRQDFRIRMPFTRCRNA